MLIPGRGDPLAWYGCRWTRVEAGKAVVSALASIGAVVAVAGAGWLAGFAYGAARALAWM